MINWPEAEATLSESAAQPKLRRARTPLSGTDRAWRVFQTAFQIALAAGIVLTLAYIYLVGMPAARTVGKAAPVVASAPRANTVILAAHIVTAILPLSIGMFAFSGRMRRASIRLHRWLGTIYCIGIWVSSILGVTLALANTHGAVARAGFATLGILWFATTLFAYLEAKKKNIPSHRRWMFRSFALTVAVVSIRPMFLIGPQWGLSSDHWYMLLTWLCWVPNLALAELYLRVTDFSGRLTPQSRMKSRSGASAATSSA